VPEGTVLVKRHHHSLRRTFWLVNRAQLVGTS
jgi:hypothetical protein